MPIHKINPSLNAAQHAHKKPEEEIHYEFSPSARRNSVFAFAEEYSKRASSEKNLLAGLDGSPSKTKPTKLVKRNSILTAAKKDHISEVQEHMSTLIHAFDTMPDMDETHFHTARGKFKIVDGDMVLLNKIANVECAASEAIDMLWDHREKTVKNIAGDVIASCEIKGTVNSNQRLLWLRYQAPTMGVAGKTSARDCSVLADKSASSSELPMITFSSVVTRLIPPHKDNVRGDTKVLGFVVEPLEPRKCTIFFACEFAMHGGFEHPLSKCLLKCSGVDKMAAKTVSADCNHALHRLKSILETRSKKKQAALIADE